MAVQPEEGDFNFNALLTAFKGIQKGNYKVGNFKFQLFLKFFIYFKNQQFKF